MKDMIKKMLASKLTAWLAVVMVSAYLGNAWIQEHVFTSGTWNYRITVRIETPEGIKEGSAVRMVWARHGIPILTNMNVGFGVRGDAVVVDLGKRGKVFALLKGYHIDGDSIVFKCFKRPDHPRGGGELTKEGVRYYRALKEGKAVLQPKFYPYLVRFKDVDDPQSIEAIMSVNTDRNEIAENHFQEMFGAGVTLKDITIEITTDPVTRTIEQWPEWMRVPREDKYLGKRSFGQYPFDSIKRFSTYEFTRGF